uniref:Uncharacterized protein n=1 Tax=Rhizophora mucronata TaxID=61149 RepID=A0A2P2Q061_RHIMU
MTDIVHAGYIVRYFFCMRIF